MATSRKKIQNILDTFPESSHVGEIASNNRIEYHRHDTLIDGCMEKQVWAIYTGYQNPCIWGTLDEVIEALWNEQSCCKICDEAIMDEQK